MMPAMVLRAARGCDNLSRVVVSVLTRTKRLHGLIPPGLMAGLFLCQMQIAAAQSVAVRVHEGRVTLNAVDAPWNRLLHELTKQTGVRFHDAGASSGRITISCVDMSAARLLSCLWGGGSMTRYAAETLEREAAWPAEVWLLGSSGALHRADITTAYDPPDPLPAPPKSAPAAHAQRHWAAILDETGSADPGARLRALSALAGEPERPSPAARAAFRAALSDDDADVRAQGVWALSNRGGHEATEVLRVALQDRVAAVRLMAVDSVEQGRRGRVLLRVALADSDETVRTAAAAKLRDNDGRFHEGRR